MYFHTCLKTPGSFLNLANWNRPCRWIKVVFQRRLIIIKRMWYCTTIVWKHDSSVSLGFKTIYNIYIYIQFSWCLPHKKKDNYCLWEVHDLNLSTVFLHFMLHTYSVAPNASKWRYTCFLFQCGISSWILPHLNLMTTIVLKHCILQLNMCFFFSGSGLLLIKTSYLIMAISRIGYFWTWGKPTFQRWQQAPPVMVILKREHCDKPWDFEVHKQTIFSVIRTNPCITWHELWNIRLHIDIDHKHGSKSRHKYRCIHGPIRIDL